MHFTFPLTVLNDCLACRIELRGTIFEKDLGILATHFFSRPAVNFFRALVPEQNILIEIAYEDGVLRLVQKLGLFANLLLGPFSLRYVAANRDVLVRFFFRVQEGNDRGVDPVIASIFGAIFYLSTPDFPARYRGPQISNEYFGMIARVDDAVIIPK